jgi:hypothetical protein
MSGTGRESSYLKLLRKTIETRAVTLVEGLTSGLATQPGKRIARPWKSEAATRSECLRERRREIHPTHFSLKAPVNVLRLAVDLVGVIRVVVPVLVTVELVERKPSRVPDRVYIPGYTAVHIVTAVLVVVDGVVESSPRTPAM